MVIQKMSVLQLSCSILYVLMLHFLAQTSTQEVADLNEKRTDYAWQLWRDWPSYFNRVPYWMIRPKPNCRDLDESCMRYNPTPSQRCCREPYRKCVYDDVLGLHRCKVGAWVWGKK